jgi:hypothetical protein
MNSVSEDRMLLPRVAQVLGAEVAELGRLGTCFHLETLQPAHHHTIHQTTIACQPYRGICTHRPWATVAASHQTKTSAAKVAQSPLHLHRPRTTRQQQRCRKVAGLWDRAPKAPAVHHPEKPPPKQPRCVPTNSPRSPRRAIRGSLNPRGWLRRLGYDRSQPRSTTWAPWIVDRAAYEKLKS